LRGFDKEKSYGDIEDISRMNLAWSTPDLIGVSRDIIEHILQVSPIAKPKK
jgi:hypothetical protein